MTDKTVYRASSTQRWYFHDLSGNLKGGPYRWRWIAAISLWRARRKLPRAHQQVMPWER